MSTCGLHFYDADKIEFEVPDDPSLPKSLRGRLSFQQGRSAGEANGDTVYVDVHGSGAQLRMFARNLVLALERGGVLPEHVALYIVGGLDAVDLEAGDASQDDLERRALEYALGRRADAK